MGTKEWRTLADMHGHPREQGFVSLYRRELKSRGAGYVIPFRMGDDIHARTLYYLVHATKHIKGAELMKQAMVVSGSRCELGYAGEARHRMSPLFAMDVHDLPNYLLRKFAGQTLTFNDVIAQTLEETGICLEKDYRKCLKQLAKLGRIGILQVSTVQGLDNDDRIQFPAAVGLSAA